MTVPYHFIVAGLPDIIFEDGQIDANFGAFLSDMKEMIPAEDAALLVNIGYSADNRNLIYLLMNKKEPVNRIGNFTEEELKEEIKNPDQIPDYMQEFLAAYDDKTDIIPNVSWENQLYWLFYDYATALDNRFLRDWFTFDMNIRNVLTAINCKRTSRNLEERLICRNEITDLLLKSSAPDFKLPTRLPWADDLFAIDFDDIAHSEEKLIQLKLQQIDDMAEPGLFNIETVLRIGIILSIAERWSLLDDKTGKKMLDKIIEELEEGFQAE